MSSLQCQEVNTTEQENKVESTSPLKYVSESKDEVEEIDTTGTSGTGPAELENQFIMRLPVEPAAALREALKSGAKNIKQRLSIQLEPEKGTVDPRLRKGVVEFDGWAMAAQVMDLPTIIESQKTIDRRTFYKSADISQILICKELKYEDAERDAKASKPPKYDPNKVDKRYLYPHGITPPLKNCKKRRFRKTLKKNYIDAPETEKEIRRLFRADEESIHVKWELITEEELDSQKRNQTLIEGHPNTDVSLLKNAASDDCEYGEQALFGALSDSEEDQEDEDVDYTNSPNMMQNHDWNENPEEQVDDSIFQLKNLSTVDGDTQRLENQIQVTNNNYTKDSIKNEVLQN